MPVFYAPYIETNRELPEDESLHCVKVLRLTEGEEIRLTDGLGRFYQAVITHAHPKRCAFDILSEEHWEKYWPNRIHLAVAPTKNSDRMEWFAEKATEIGIDEITLLRCRFSERREMKSERLERILVSAMKQSEKALKPVLTGMTDFKPFVMQTFPGQKFIAHCYPDAERVSLARIYRPGEDAVILIGPEGDFSEEEIRLAVSRGFVPVTLGESRLRTETAALAACHTVQVINQMR